MRAATDPPIRTKSSVETIANKDLFCRLHDLLHAPDDSERFKTTLAKALTRPPPAVRIFANFNVADFAAFRSFAGGHVGVMAP